MRSVWVAVCLGVGGIIFLSLSAGDWFVEAETESRISPLTPVQTRIVFTDESGDQFWDSGEENLTPIITPGSRDALSVVLGPGIVGKTVGQQYVTPPLDSPFGESTKIPIPRAIYEGPVEQSVRANFSEAIGNLRLGDKVSVHPSNMSAEVIGVNETHRTLLYLTDTGVMRHPSNLLIEIQRSTDTIRFGVPYETGDEFLLTQDCADYGDLPAGWYKVDQMNETHLTTTHIPFTEGRTFTESLDIVTRTSRIQVVIEEIDFERGEANRKAAKSQGLLDEAESFSLGDQAALE